MATEADKVNTGALATILSVGALSMLGISAAVTALVRYEAETTTNAKGGMANLRGIQDLRRSQTGELEQQVRWTDRSKGLIGMPLERAMQLVVDDLKRDPNTATPPPPDPKKKEKPAEEQAPAENELGIMEPTEGDKAAEAAAEPQPGAAAPEKPAEATPAKKPAKAPAGSPAAAPQAPAPPPAAPPVAPAPAPEAPPANAP
jgi:hypothetical protein